MADMMHRLWRLAPHGARRALFSHVALALGGRAVARAEVGSTGPVTVAGSFGAPTGLGQAARLLLLGFQQAGYQTRAFDLTRLLKQPFTEELSALPPAPGKGEGVVVVVQPPPASSWALHHMGASVLAGKRLIAHWVWEYPRTPLVWRPHARLFHAIAAPTRFCADVFARDLRREVMLLPYPAALDQRWSAPPQPRARRDAFRVGFVGDLIAAAGRKNPIACVEAVARAFPEDASAELVLMLGGAGPGHPVRSEIEAAARNLGVRLSIDERHVDGASHAQRLVGLDVFLSLHRAEGFGLALVEAVLAGCPLIATGAPPLDELLSSEEGWPVPASFDRAPALIDDPDPGLWASPDIAAAARALRAVRENPSEAAAKARRARERLAAGLGAEAFAQAAGLFLGPPLRLE